MEATVQRTGKRAAKIFGAVCLATGVAALSAVVASGAAVGAVAEGFRSAKKCYAGNAEKGWKQGKCGSAGKKQRRNVKKWRTKIWQNQN